jgi:hypothetical protein
MKDNKKKQAAAHKRAKKRNERRRATEQDKAKRQKEFKDLRELYNKQFDDYFSKLMGEPSQVSTTSLSG